MKSNVLDAEKHLVLLPTVTNTNMILGLITCGIIYLEMNFAAEFCLSEPVMKNVSDAQSTIFSSTSWT